MTLLLLILFLTTGPAPVAQTCLTYEPDAVSLRGTIPDRTSLHEGVTYSD